MKICIFVADSNGAFPVPAVRGGAVQTLVDHLVFNNSDNDVQFTIVSYYDECAQQSSSFQKKATYVYIKIPQYIKILDSFVYWVVKTFFKKKKSFSYKTIFSLLFYIKKSSRYLKQNKFNCVLLENNIPLIKIIKKSKYNGKYYYHLHNVPRTNFGCLDYFLKCDGYFCVSDFVKQQITSAKSSIGRIENNKCKVLYNVINLNYFKPLNDGAIKIERQKLNINESDKIIMFSGRFTPEKGIDLLIEALEQLNDKRIKLLIASKFDISENYCKDSFEYNIIKKIKRNKENIILLGYVANQDLYKYYNLADLVVLPSVWDEPAGLTMVEALACNAKLITTTAGGIPEYMKDKCMLIENLSKNYVVEQLIKKIPICINEKKRNDGFEYVENNFSMNDYCKRFLYLLNELQK